MLQALVDSLGDKQFGHLVRPLLITPLTEEVSKGAFLIWIMLRRRAEFDDPLDAIIFGSLVGAGFAFSEQVLYFGQIVSDYIRSTSNDAELFLVVSLIIRALLVPFLHPLFVSLIGVGLVISTKLQSKVARTIISILSFVFPITLHGIWDWASVASENRYLIVQFYLLGICPLLVFFTAFAIALRLRPTT